MNRDINREAWLTQAAHTMAKWLDPEPDMTKVKASCGFPSRNALSRRKRAVGQAWSAEVSAEGEIQLFVSPLQSDGVEVLSTLLHELIHAAVGTECGHRGWFAVCAKKVGFLPPMTQTPAGPELTAELKELANHLGPYPHGAFTPSDKEKKQSTRLIKVECQGAECGCVLRMTRKWLDDVGAPTCGCGCPMDEAG